MAQKIITAISGGKIIVDTECENFGIKAGDKLILNGRKSVVAGMDIVCSKCCSGPLGRICAKVWVIPEGETKAICIDLKDLKSCTWLMEGETPPFLLFN